jgi:Flp pilus assembly protein TadG
MLAMLDPGDAYAEVGDEIRSRPDRGSAIVEFCFLALLLMVPLVYVVLAVFRVQAEAYGITAAAREAGRAFVTTDESVLAMDRARVAASVAAADHGVELPPDALTISCSAQPCLTAGGRVYIAIDASVPLPFLPPVLGDRAAASIAVRARHTEVVDTYRMVN